MDSMDSTLQSVRYVIKATVCANFGRDRVHFLLQLSVAPNLVKNRFQSEKPVRVFHTLTLAEKIRKNIFYI